MKGKAKNSTRNK